jgi:hypothetical protein
MLAGCRARGGARRAGRPAGHEAFQNRHFLDEPIRSKLSFCRVSGKDDRGYGFRCLSPIDTTPKSTFDPTFPGRTPIPGGMGGFATTEGSSECRAEGQLPGLAADLTEPRIPRLVIAPFLVITAHLSRVSCRSS